MPHQYVTVDEVREAARGTYHNFMPEGFPVLAAAPKVPLPGGEKPSVGAVASFIMNQEKWSFLSMYGMQSAEPSLLRMHTRLMPMSWDWGDHDEGAYDMRAAKTQRPILSETFYRATLDGMKPYRCVSVMGTTRTGNPGVVLQEIDGPDRHVVDSDEFDRFDPPALFTEWHRSAVNAARWVADLRRAAEKERLKSSPPQPVKSSLDKLRDAILSAVSAYRGRFKTEYTRALCGMTEAQDAKKGGATDECIGLATSAIADFELALERGYRPARACGDCMCDFIVKRAPCAAQVTFISYVKLRGFNPTEASL
jgi:hypothetical protein